MLLDNPFAKWVGPPELVKLANKGKLGGKGPGNSLALTSGEEVCRYDNVNCLD
jgi:hypothetical protein